MVHVAEQDGALVAAMLEVCTKGIRSGACTTGDEANAAVIATVEWQDAARLSASVRVQWSGSKTALGDVVHFTDADALAERYRALGLVIATLTGEVRHIVETAPPPLPPPAPPPPPPPRPAPRPPATTRRSVLAFDLGALGATDGTASVGGLGRASFEPLAWLFFELDERALLRPTDASGLGAITSSTTAGVGVRFTFGPLRLGGRVGAGAAWLEAHVTDPATGASDAQSIWVGVGRVGVEASAPPARLFGAFVGVDASAHTPVELRVRNAERAGFLAFELSLGLGVRFSPF